MDVYWPCPVVGIPSIFTFCHSYIFESSSNLLWKIFLSLCTLHTSNSHPPESTLVQGVLSLLLRINVHRAKMAGKKSCQGDITSSKWIWEVGLGGIAETNHKHVRFPVLPIGIDVIFSQFLVTPTLSSLNFHTIFFKVHVNIYMPFSCAFLPIYAFLYMVLPISTFWKQLALI